MLSDAQLTSDAMCTLLLSVMDDKIRRTIQHDLALVSDTMVSFPVMIPGTRYYKGIKVCDTYILASSFTVQAYRVHRLTHYRSIVRVLT